MPKRIGIYAGTFNPVHSGHLAVALQAMEAAQLDELYFLPERQPRYKTGVAHFGHRVAMLHRAVQPHPHFGIIELPDVNLSVQRTLPRLQRRFPNDQLVFVMGSDAASALQEWPYVEQLLASCELAVAIRDHVAELPQAKRITIFESYAPEVSSGSVREALRRHQPAKGVLPSVAQYSDRHWLYVSLAQTYLKVWHNHKRFVTIDSLL